MRNIGIIIKTDLKNNLSSKSVVAIWYGISILLAAAMVVLFGILLLGPELKKAIPDMEKLDLYMALILFSVSLIGLGVNLNALGFTSMIREKARGNIQSLMVTNLSIREIWIGKSLAIFIPGLIIGELLTIIALVATNYFYFVPVTGFLFNPWVAATSLIVFPIIYLAVGLLVYLVGLTGKPVNANIISQVFLPVYVNLVVQLMIHADLMDYTSWPFMLANTGVAVIIAVIVIILQQKLTSEKVALSY